eukprot:m.57119 g.57119  ORF g.57119 m.57119 type:complete len:281 (+) comp13438_c0_seq1:113-955(+)
MGSAPSNSLPQDYVLMLAQQSHFTKKELRQLHNRFVRRAIKPVAAPAAATSLAPSPHVLGAGGGALSRSSTATSRSSSLSVLSGGGTVLMCDVERAFSVLPDQALAQPFHPSVAAGPTSSLATAGTANNQTTTLTTTAVGTVASPSLSSSSSLASVPNPAASLVLHALGRQVTNQFAGSLEFAALVSVLSVFRASASDAEKSEALFRIIDVSSDGFLDEQDLGRFFAMVTHKTLSATQATSIARQLIARKPSLQCGLSRADFAELLWTPHLRWRMTWELF